MKSSYIYIVTNKYNTTLYTGVTSNLIKRIYEHKNNTYKGFTRKYNLEKLVYYEVFEDIYQAINREKQIKSGKREKKEILINNLNPSWVDLYEDICK